MNPGVSFQQVSMNANDFIFFSIMNSLRDICIVRTFIPYGILKVSPNTVKRMVVNRNIHNLMPYDQRSSLGRELPEMKSAVRAQASVDEIKGYMSMTQARLQLRGCRQWCCDPLYLLPQSTESCPLFQPRQVEGNGQIPICGANLWPHFIT